MITQNNLKTRYGLVGKVLSNFTLTMLCLCMAYLSAQGENTGNGYTNLITVETATADSEGDASYCKHPTFHPCEDEHVLDFNQHGYHWPVNSKNGTYTVGDQTFDIHINDPKGIFGALHEPVDPDDIGSYENGAGIAIGINPHHRDDELEIIYKLSKISDNVAFTIRDLDKKNYQGSSKQTEKVCVYGYCDGEPVMPIITSLCGSVFVKDNCAVATKNSHESKKDESIRVVFDKCIDEIKIVYGNADNAPKNPSYSKIYIGDDIGFGTAHCNGECKPCAVEPACASPRDGSEVIYSLRCLREDGTALVFPDLDDAGIGDNSTWVITDDSNNIVEVIAELNDYTPAILTEGLYNFYYINWNGELSAPLNVGANLVEIINNSECAAIGKPAYIEVALCCNIQASTLVLIDTGGDGCGGQASIDITGGNGNNSIWIVTDESGNIINTTDEPPFDLTTIGILLIWNLNWDFDLSAPLTPGSNLQNIVNNSACAALSNSVSVIRKKCCKALPAEISLQGGDNTLDVCVNDETLELVNFTLTNAGSGDNSAWVITDENGIISSSSTNAPTLNLYAATLGTMQIWYLTWDDNLSTDLNVDANINEIVQNSECAVLSNPIIIFKDCCCPYYFEFTEENIFCNIGGDVGFNPRLLLDKNLVLDDGQTIVCDIEGYGPCSPDPGITDSNGDPVSGTVREPGIFTVSVVPCRCAAPVDFVLTQQLIDDCISVPAPVPQVMNVTESSATLICQHESPVTIEFRKSGDATFSTYDLEIGNDMLLLTNLESCTIYEYRSKVTDAEGNSTTCAIQTLTTIGCKNIDIGNVNLRTLNVGSTSAVLTWDNIPGCVYTLYYRMKGQEKWKSYDTTISYVIMFGLNSCTEYEWALRISEGDLQSDISANQLILTTCQGPRLSSPNTDDVRIGTLSDLQNIELNVFVNPSSKTLTVDCMGLPAKSVGIYNVNGQLVKSLNINNNNINTINVSTLKAGVYFLVTVFEDGIARNKFSINK